MIPLMTAFIPPTHIQLYMPVYFQLWEAFNSSVLDDRLLELCGELSEEHIAGKQGEAGEDGGAEWKDVGIWTEAEWTRLVGKALGSMSMHFYLLANVLHIDSCCDFIRRSGWQCQSASGMHFIVDFHSSPMQGASTTAAHADSMADKGSMRIRKPIVRYSPSVLPYFVVSHLIILL